jgi:4-diphosphocytidyl-2-C-methyl-D-erythritol kinase
MIVYPNAKINIGLNVLSKRSDGFHNIESCFLPINLTDILEIIPSALETHFQASGISIPGNAKNNLCVKAWEILNKDFNISPVTIHLHKQIPIGAGLGGGSADGAFALKALSELFKLNLSIKQLENYASKMGSDCTFFIKNKPAFVEGVGDILSNLTLDLSSYTIILVNPGIHISTPEAYSGIIPYKAEKKLSSLIKSPIENWQQEIKNDFEVGIFKTHAQIEEIKNKLIELGATYAAMSGSGSTVFGLFPNTNTINFQNYFQKMFIWKGKFA